MAEFKLYDINNNVKELEGTTLPLERDIEKIIESNMKTFFGVTFLASQYATDDRSLIMDSIGIDENKCPVIFEYKCRTNENVINQGLSYLNWLVTHKANFELLVRRTLGIEIKNTAEIEWSNPRLICIAGDFNKFDKDAINSMARQVSLYKYVLFENNGNKMLLLEKFADNANKKPVDETPTDPANKTAQKTFTDKLNNASENIRSLYDDINNYILSLGDGDITESVLKFYKAYKKFSNFVCVEVHNSQILLSLKLDTATVAYEVGFSKDMSQTGHYGTGDVQLTIKTEADFEKAKPLLERAYNDN